MSLVDVLTQLGGAMVVALDPLRRALVVPTEMAVLLRREGWRPPELGDGYPQLAAAFALGGGVERAVAALEALDNGELTVEEVRAALDSATQLLRDLEAVARPPGPLPSPLDLDEFWADFPVDLIQDLLATYLEQAHPAAFAPLYLLGVVDEHQVQPIGDARVPYRQRRLRWDRLVTMFTDPASLPRDVYGWGTTFDHGAVTLRLEVALRALGVLAGRQPPPGALAHRYYTVGAPEELRMLRTTLLRERRSAGGVELGVAVLPIPAADGGAPVGLFVGPVVEGAAGTELALGGPFTLRLGGGLKGTGVVGIELRPGRMTPRLDGAPATLALSAALVGKPAQPWLLVGHEYSDRLELLDLTLAVELAGSLTDPELKLRIATGGLRLTIDPADADGFLQSLFGSDPKPVEVGGALIWSSKTGLHFDGQAGMRSTIPVDVAFGLVHLTQLVLELKADSGRLVTSFGVTGSLALGPVTASVENVGVALVLAPANSPARGTFGDLDVDFGFKPPTGLGLSFTAPVVSGGGFLSCDPDAGRYTGALHVKLTDTIELAAFGVLQTGTATQHWSLLVILAGHIPPIELGWNFRLTGLGGLLALHRGMDTDALRDAAYGIRGSLDDLLFPDSPETRLPQLLPTIERFFPPRTGSHVAGPMAEIEWGRGGVVNARVRAALLLQLDGSRVALYGTVRIGFPSLDADSTLRIRAGIEALFDAREQLARFSITILEATLFGSIQFTGGAAFFVRWGSGRAFAFTVGGFHPAFRPYIPAGLIEPPRLGVHWNPVRGVRFDLTHYYAITTTSMQYGAAAHAEVGCSWGKVTGDLAFDLLVMTSPALHLEADLHVRVTVTVFGADLLSAGLDGSLAGPGPWVLAGQVTWKVWIFHISKSVHFEWGEPTPIDAPPQSAGQLLGDEMQAPGNWTSFRTRPLPVRVRTGVAALAPRDELEVRQSRLPFGTRVEVADGSPLSDPGVWTLTCTGASGLRTLSAPTDVFPERRFVAEPSTERPFRGGLSCGARLGRADWDIPAVAIAVAGTATDDVVVDGDRTVDGAVALPPVRVADGVAGALAATAPARAFDLGALEAVS